MPLIERIVLILFLLLALAAFVMGYLGPNPKFMDADWWQAYFDVVGTVSMWTILPLWAAMRILSLAVNRPSRYGID